MSGDVFDLDSLAAEAGAEPFRFRLGGEEFTLPAATDLDWRDARALERGELETAFPALLGDQYERFAAQPLGVGKLAKLIEGYMRHQGLTPGESPASSGS
jgi:hypothetical protein